METNEFVLIVLMAIFFSVLTSYLMVDNFVRDVQDSSDEVEVLREELTALRNGVSGIFLLSGLVEETANENGMFTSVFRLRDTKHNINITNQSQNNGN